MTGAAAAVDLRGMVPLRGAVAGGMSQKVLDTGPKVHSSPFSYAGRQEWTCSVVQFASTITFGALSDQRQLACLTSSTRAR